MKRTNTGGAAMEAALPFYCGEDAMLPAGLYPNITIEHLLVVEGDGEALVVTYDKYKSLYLEHPSEPYATVEAALDAMFEATNTLSPNWPLEYIPRQARFLRALCDDPEDATFSTLGRVGESITLTAAVDLFHEQEIRITEEDVADVMLKVSPLAYIRNILDTPVGELFNVAKTDRRESAESPEAPTLDAGEGGGAHSQHRGNPPKVRRPADRIEQSNDAHGGVGTAAAEGGNAPYAQTKTDTEGYEVFEWPEPHRL